MAKAQFPIDGKLGKDFKPTSLMGMRIHPVTKQKKHHNGTDIWSPHEPCWIEAPFDATVLEAKKSTAPGGGFGNYVIILMKINGKFYTSLFAHMGDGTLKVKKGQKIEAGTPLGKMASTGMSTGKHLHWELRLGKQHVWDANGKNYIEPIAFFKALIAQEAAIATAGVVATEDDPVAPAPTHNASTAAKVEAERKGIAPVVKPAVAKPVATKPAKPALKAELKVGSTGAEVKWLQTRLGVPATGTFDNVTKAAVIKFQKTRKEITKPDGAVGNLTWKALG
jgi:murein DD-endopeptidase MepM/ murein hydrolase activator NlpD